MKRIVLLCNGGLSTGILVKKMKAAADSLRPPGAIPDGDRKEAGGLSGDKH